VVLQAIQLRVFGEITRSKNIAVARTEINGLPRETLAGLSGEKPRSGFVPPAGTPGNPKIFHAWPSGNNSREADSEYNLLNYIANQLGPFPELRGRIVLFSERPVCSSCTFVIGQFRAIFPGIEIVVIPISGG
jgi:hypothetical protein